MAEPGISDDLDATFERPADDASDLVDRVAEEFAERCRRGESPSVVEYARRYPEHAEKIRELLPSVAMMERLKGHLRSSSDAACDVLELPPERIGEYRIVRELGRGGMGIVYEAYQESLERHVALKVIPRHGLLDPRRRRRFQREAMAVAQLHHTNIVPIFAAGEHDGLPFYAMQYIRGDGLDRLLDGWRRGGMERGADHWRFVARVGIQAAEALQYAHDQGILHRDVKPANVLIDEHQVAWLTDFGLAKMAGRDELTHSGDVVGTLRYLAPEALRGPIDGRGDIYSLGLTLYELLTLRQPFGDLSPSELLRCVTEEQPTRPRKLDRSIPLDFETIVLKATAREPGHRYAKAGELADDLRAFLDDRPIRARRASPPERLARWCRRNRLLATVTATAAASILLALAAATGGYIAANQALDRANANVEMSLDAINLAFNAFRDPTDEGPFADGGPPQGRGRLGPPPSRRGEGLRGPLPEPGFGPPTGPGMPGEMPERELALLQIILDFYDRFAERNESNSRLQLQGEAARSYRKAATLAHRLGLDQQAEQSQEKALKRFEALVRFQGEDSEYGYDLARALARDGLDAVDVPSERAEPDLRRAIAIVERLSDRGPESKRCMYAAALARWKASLASQLDRLGRPEDAASAYRASIAHDEWLFAQMPGAPGVREMLAWNRSRLAEILIRLERREEARPLVDEAADDAIALAGEGRSPLRPGGPLADALGSLARSYRGLGEFRRAEECAALAEKLRNRPRFGRPEHRGGGGFPNPKKAPRGVERGHIPGPFPDDRPAPPGPG